jgi:hypothetical protein
MPIGGQQTLAQRRAPWNKGRLIGQKRPPKRKEVWTIRVRLQLEKRRRDLAMFNLAIDSKLRGCGLVRLQIEDVSVGGRVRDASEFFNTIDPKPTLGKTLFEHPVGLRLPEVSDQGDVGFDGERVRTPRRFRTYPIVTWRRDLIVRRCAGTHRMRRSPKRASSVIERQAPAWLASLRKTRRSERAGRVA